MPPRTWAGQSPEARPSPASRNTLIADNSSGSGGGVSIAIGTLEIVGSTITRNTGTSGGGLAVGGATVTITDSTIADNVATGGVTIDGNEVSGSGGESPSSRTPPSP